MDDLRYNPEEMIARGFSREAIARARLALEARELAHALMAKIERSFVPLPRPRITKSVARGYDDEWFLSEERIQELAAADSEQSWRDVSDADVRTFQEYFTFADPDGCRFYLPAYLREYLGEFPYSAYWAVYDACMDPAKLSTLSPEERVCVDEFLALCELYQPDIPQ